MELELELEAFEAEDFEAVDLDPDEDFRLLDFAIANLPWVAAKTHQERNGSVPVRAFRE